MHINVDDNTAVVVGKIAKITINSASCLIYHSLLNAKPNPSTRFYHYHVAVYLLQTN